MKKKKLVKVVRLDFCKLWGNYQPRTILRSRACHHPHTTFNFILSFYCRTFSTIRRHDLDTLMTNFKENSNLIYIFFPVFVALSDLWQGSSSPTEHNTSSCMQVQSFAT